MVATRWNQEILSDFAGVRLEMPLEPGMVFRESHPVWGEQWDLIDENHLMNMDTSIKKGYNAGIPLRFFCLLVLQSQAEVYYAVG